MQKRALLVTLIILAQLSYAGVPARAPAQREQEGYRLASEYSARHRGLSVLVIKGGKVVFEQYQNGHNAETAHLLASGTKSFSGVMAVAAVEDGLLKLDDRVSETITEWRSDRQKSQITIRQLLTLTSGIDTGENGRPPAYAEAIKLGMKHEPGTTFEYGPVPFQVFGEVMRRKLEAKGETPLDYLKRRLFGPIGLEIASWRHQMGQPNMPSGAFLTAREWAKFGRFILNRGKWDGHQIISAKLLAECFEGTKANPNYGLTFWLNRSQDGSANVAAKTGGFNRRLQEVLDRDPETTKMSKQGLGRELPKDIIMAAGAGKQRLYIIPSLDLVIVRQGQLSPFDDREFLSHLVVKHK